MDKTEKVKRGLFAHSFGCGKRSPFCDGYGCPYIIDDKSCDIEQLCKDALELLKEQQAIIDSLLKVGYPHNFQMEKPWIVAYMQKITEVVKKAFHLRNKWKDGEQE